MMHAVMSLNFGTPKNNFLFGTNGNLLFIGVTLWYFLVITRYGIMYSDLCFKYYETCRYYIEY